MRFKTSVAIIMVFGLLLQGCGRKGPLTMPVAHQPVAASPVVTPAVPAAGK